LLLCEKNIIEAAKALQGKLVTEPISPISPSKNFVQQVYEACAKVHISPDKIQFRETGRYGPAHSPTFRVSLSIQGQFIAEGEGSNIKSANEEAAMAGIDKVHKICANADPLRRNPKS